MAADLVIKRNDLLPIVVVVCRDSVGPVDLTDHTALFRMVNVLNGAVKIPNGEVDHGVATVSPTLTFVADATTNILTSNAHGLNDGDDVTLKSSGTLPGGLDDDIRYFVVNRTANTLQLALVAGGAPIDITSVGSGTHSLLTGKVSYEWTGTDTDTAGTYFGEVQTTNGDDKPLSYPNDGHLLIEIVGDLV
jgi:hypothetical protein